MIEIKSLRKERNKVFNLGGNKRRLVCHCKPIHYKPKGKTGWDDINLDFQDDGKGNFIADKNKVSIGFRKDRLLNKYFGVRYDYEHQFESTIKEIVLDNVEQVKSDKVVSLQRKSLTEVKHQLNSDVEIINKINEVSLKNFVKVNNPIEDFKLVEELHLKGLTCSNKKKGSKYAVDNFGRFNFVDEKGELKFWINKPFFIDNAGQTSQNIIHTLEEIDGKLIYTKTPTKEGQDDLLLAIYPILIDTNTYYSSTADGNITLGGSDWTIQSATTGDSVDNTSNYDSAAMWAYYSAKGPTTNITRSFFYFNTSNLPDAATITGAVLKLYGYSNTTVNVCAQKGTQADTLTTADYNNFSGSEYGHNNNWASESYNSIIFNATGKADVNKTGVTKICCRDYDYDYSNSISPSALVSGCYYAEETGTTKDPKLEIDYTEDGAEATGNFFQLF